MTDLVKVYEKLRKVPSDKILQDLQIIHNTLNDPVKTNVYFQYIDDQINRRVNFFNWTPTKSLAVELKETAEMVKYKLPKLFESAPSEIGFLDTMRNVKRPFQDVSAGFFHGEYEHALQLDFIRRMYKYAYYYRTRELQCDYGKAWDAMFDPNYVVTVPGGGGLGKTIHLSLWDLVLDIQGGFVRGDSPGLTAVEGLQDSYKGLYATSATLLHYGFGAYLDKNSNKYKDKTGMAYGDLAKQFPYLAAAIIDRHMKRQKESDHRMGIGKYKTKFHNESAKEARHHSVVERIKQFGPSRNIKGIEESWTVKPSKHVSEGTEFRKNEFPKY